MSAKLVILFICFLVVDQARPDQKGWDDESESSPRPIGNYEAKKHSSPYHVSLHEDNPAAQGFTFIGSGAILSDQWILTAASLVSNPIPYHSFAIKAGKHDEEVFNDEQFVFIEKIYNHPGFTDGKYSSHNIALLKLKKPLIFDFFVSPIALPRQGDIPEGNAILSEWFINDQQKVSQLHIQDLPIVNLTACRESFYSIANPHEYSRLKNKHLCTGPLTGNYKGATNNDVGSPLIKRHSNTPDELVGIVSWEQLGDSLAAAPTVYTRVSAYSDWIRIMIRDLDD